MGARHGLEGKAINTTLSAMIFGDGFISCFLCKNSMNATKEVYALRKLREFPPPSLPPIVSDTFRRNIVALGRKSYLLTLHFEGNIASAILKGGKRACQDMGFVANAQGYSLIGVFDGLGKFGGKAARISLEACLAALCNDPADTLISVITKANKAVLEALQKENDGTSGAAAVIARIKPEGFAAIGWLGDCRAYVARKDGKCELITVDHGKFNRENLVLPFCPDGLDRLSKKQIQNYLSQRELLESFIGKMEIPPSNIFCQLESGDSLVLCSDGIGDVMTKREIGNAVKGKKPDEAAQALVGIARSRGLHQEYENKFGERIFGKQGDDITAIVYRQP
jgi:serine/threonine protein phosphatase PrpC